MASTSPSQFLETANRSAGCGAEDGEIKLCIKSVNVEQEVVAGRLSKYLIAGDQLRALDQKMFFRISDGPEIRLF